MRFISRTYPPAIAIALVLSCTAPLGAAEEDEPRVPGVSTWISGKELHVEAKLIPPLPAEVSQRLSSGLSTSMAWQIRLFAFRNLWWDSLKDERRYEVTATYRPVTGDYLVERRLDAKLLDTRVVPTREEAAVLLSRVPGLSSFTMGDHLLGKKLVVRVRCAFSAGVTLAVVPTTRETDWVRSGVFEWKEGGAR